MDMGTPYNYGGVAMSGYLGVNKGDSSLAFLFYNKENASQEELKHIPTVLWLSGGPGTSSKIANLMEIRPFLIRSSKDQSI